MFKTNCCLLSKYTLCFFKYFSCLPITQFLVFETLKKKLVFLLIVLKNQNIFYIFHYFFIYLINFQLRINRKLYLVIIVVFFSPKNIHTIFLILNNLLSFIHKKIEYFVLLITIRKPRTPFTHFQIKTAKFTHTFTSPPKKTIRKFILKII